MKHAAMHYRNPFFTKDELKEDYRRIRSFIRCFDEHVSGGELKIRLAFNHFVIATNCFGVDFVVDECLNLSRDTTRPLIVDFIQTITTGQATTEFQSTILAALKETL